jgi:ADP-heptose:LPS heptosyltransferase
MAGEPILVLQMQRMGDLLLSFPLMLWLGRCHPGHPVHVVAEESFFRPLMPTSPHAAYISWRDAAAGALAGKRYRLIINLSIREEAARLAGTLEAERKVGPVRGADGALRVLGGWQLYRASLVGQGRHNRFHWADLNALDLVPLEAFRLTTYPPPAIPAPDNDRVGLFLGASEPGKRPDAAFFAGLARALLERGLKPVLLGGPDDKPLAEAVRRESGLRLADMVGRLGLTAFAEFCRSLALFITPDTGPMHLAAWTGTPALNLSIGHVNPWDTGPYQPGHLVLRSTASCARGCWSCRLPACPCRAALQPRPVAALAALAVRAERARLARVRLPGLDLFETARTADGLYDLRRLGPAREPSAADLAGEFWRRAMLWMLKERPGEDARDAFARLAASHPRLAGRLRATLPRTAQAVALFQRDPAGATALLRAAPPFWRPLASLLEMSGQNADASDQWEQESLARLSGLAALLS